LIVELVDKEDGTPSPTAAPPSEETILDLLKQEFEFKTIVQLLELAGVAEIFDEPGTYTLFAPPDYAFSLLPPELVEKLTAPLWKPQLQDVLGYHVLGQIVLSSDLVDGSTPTTLNFESESILINTVPKPKVSPSTRSGEIMITGVNPLYDIIGSNGVIHGIDGVLTPASLTNNVVDTVAAEGYYSILVELVTIAGLGEALSGDGPFTLFGPTDGAFSKLPSGVLDSLKENVEELKKVLLYHVIPYNALGADLVEYGSADSLEGSPLVFEAEGDMVMVNDVKVEGAPFIASNGIIHKIYDVLIPPDLSKVGLGIDIYFDDFPEDISWELFDVCGGPAGVLIAEGRGYGPDVANTAVTVFPYQQVNDGKFLFVIKDSFGDGLCCNHVHNENVGYLITYKFEDIRSDFEMKGEETQEFGSSVDCQTGPDNKAAYAPKFGTPGCDTASETGICTTVGTGLLVGKTVTDEPNGPNTLDGCSDGRDGVYGQDESIEAITVTSVTGEFEPKQMAAGGSAKITAHVFAFCNPEVEDVVDFWTTSEEGEDGLEWNYIGTEKPTVCGFGDVESPNFTLTASPGQAVRAVIRWVAGGDRGPMACPDENDTYTDTDDLVFAIAPTHSACYDFTTHQCKCTKDTCTKEKCNATPGGIWTNTCPEACTCPEFDPPTPSPTPVPGPSEGAACYDISIHKCKCEANLCDREKCTEAGMIWTQTCVPTDSTPEPCTCDDFGRMLSAPLAPLGIPAETECAGYSAGRCAAAAAMGCVWKDNACS